MATLLIVVALVIVSVLVFYVVFQAMGGRFGVEPLPSPDIELGLRAAITQEKARLTQLQSWYEQTERLYHQRVLVRRCLGDPLDEHNQRALWSNVERARQAIERHRRRLEALRREAEQHGIALDEVV